MLQFAHSKLLRAVEPNYTNSDLALRSPWWLGAIFLARYGEAVTLEPEAQGSHASRFGLLLHALPGGLRSKRLSCRGYIKVGAPSLKVSNRDVLKPAEGLKIERRLHLAEVIELGSGLIAGRVFLRVGDVFLSVLDRLDESVSLEFNKVDGRLGENSEAGGADLGKAAAYKIAPALRAARDDFEKARPETREQRGVMGEHGEVALGPRHQNLLDHAGDE